MHQSLDIQVRDTVFDPHAPAQSDRKVYVWEQPEGPPLYKVWLYLEGRHLPFVESATYTLHPTFPEPTRTVRRILSNPTCELVIWTWGIFDVNVLIHDTRGHRYTLVHRLSYPAELPKERAEYEFVREDPAATPRFVR